MKQNSCCKNLVTVSHCEWKDIHACGQIHTNSSTTIHIFNIKQNTFSYLDKGGIASLKIWDVSFYILYWLTNNCLHSVNIKLQFKRNLSLASYHI